ncbi:DUF4291 family protein [Pseudobacteroides cellulosolvens]|uniref:Uncharacterized protein n=1 Tax=Pseudobacteroides cellulosolvens ATCC 35603 = DSM 2933 TaxID=398512 RepID=A0A0L6JMA8_9FIRM|nr:DUF4291 family protein [Pseudobacteroides cellulosolvens]KNY26904.1 Protein of unknown function DUF4291 [Pseudobacteroides cellulosolvens ATCC 35603 = DSM 2933]
MKLNRRAIQIGLRNEAIKKYVYEWIIGVEDVTDLAKEISSIIKSGKDVSSLLPDISEYPISDDLKNIIGYT